MEFGKKIRVPKSPFRQVRDRTLQRVDQDDHARSGDARPEVKERLSAASDYPSEEIDGSTRGHANANEMQMQGESQRLLLQRLQRQRVLRRQQGRAQVQGEELREVVDPKGGVVFCLACLVLCFVDENENESRTKEH